MTKAEGTAAEKYRLIQLDLLRGIAVFLIMGSHPAVHPSAAGALSSLAWSWNMYGWVGLEIFFVLSGFLIGGLLFKEWKRYATLDARRFLIRRGFKIWPAYFLYITFIILWFTLQSPPENVKQVLAMMAPNLLHLQNYIPTLAIHTWSLALEEHFYLALPYVLLLAARKDHNWRRSGVVILLGGLALVAIFGGLWRLAQWLVATETAPKAFIHYYLPYTRLPFALLFGAQLFGLAALVMAAVSPRGAADELRAVSRIAIGVLALCLLYRTFTHWISPRWQIDYSFTFYATHLRMDAVFFGVLLAYWTHFKPRMVEWWEARRLALLIAGVVIINIVVALNAMSVETHLADRSLIYVGCGCALIGLVHTPPGEGRLGRLLIGRASRLTAFIGLHSYTIYLWHINPVRYALTDKLVESLKPWLAPGGVWLLVSLLYLVVCIGFGILLSKLVEMPFLWLRDRLYPARASALANPPPGT